MCAFWDFNLMWVWSKKKKNLNIAVVCSLVKCWRYCWLTTFSGQRMEEVGPLMAVKSSPPRRTPPPAPAITPPTLLCFCRSMKLRWILCILETSDTKSPLISLSIIVRDDLTRPFVLLCALQRSPEDEKALQMLTFIGCGISLCGLILTLILFTAVGCVCVWKSICNLQCT